MKPTIVATPSRTELEMGLREQALAAAAKQEPSQAHRNAETADEELFHGFQLSVPVEPGTDNWKLTTASVPEQ